MRFGPQPDPPEAAARPSHACRDALEVCGGLWGEQRQDCLTVFGLDADQVRCALGRCIMRWAGLQLALPLVCSSQATFAPSGR